MRDAGSTVADTVEARIAARLARLRAERGLSLDALAERTGISRATLSRIEHGTASPTAAMLGRLCAAYGWTLSRLMAAAEGADDAPRLLRRADQPAWTDPETGFRRRAASPPAPGLRGEAVSCVLPPGAGVAYPDPPGPGLEHHVLLLDGALEVEMDGERVRLAPGDAYRRRLWSASRYANPGPAEARYLVFIIQP